MTIRVIYLWSDWENEVGGGGALHSLSYVRIWEASPVANSMIQLKLSLV